MKVTSFLLFAQLGNASLITKCLLLCHTKFSRIGGVLQENRATPPEKGPVAPTFSETPCASQEGASMLLRRKGGLLRREGGFLTFLESAGKIFDRYKGRLKMFRERFLAFIVPCLFWDQEELRGNSSCRGAVVTTTSL